MTSRTTRDQCESMIRAIRSRNNNLRAPSAWLLQSKNARLRPSICGVARKRARWVRGLSCQDCADRCNEEIGVHALQDETLDTRRHDGFQCDATISIVNEKQRGARMARADLQGQSQTRATSARPVVHDDQFRRTRLAVMDHLRKIRFGVGDATPDPAHEDLSHRRSDRCVMVHNQHVCRRQSAGLSRSWALRDASSAVGI